MRCLFSIFSNRELALIVWLVILFLFLLAWNKGLYHFKKIIACVFATKLIGLYISLIIYISIIVIILWLLGFWNIGLLKDTIIWLIFSALGILFSLNKVKDATYFTNLIKSSVTIVVVVQFFINLYTFGFWVEFIMIPILAFITMLSVYTEHNTMSNSDYKKVNSCLNTFFGITALVYIVFAVYETIIEFKTTNWIDVSKQFLLPIILTMVFIPFFWILALYMKYEMIFVSNNVIFRDKSKIIKLKIKLCMLYYGHFSFKRVHRIWNKMAFLAYEENTNYRKYIKEVAKPPLYKKSHIINKMRITPFNNIDECCKSLTSLQIGEFTEWKKLHGFDDFYCSTGYYSIKHYGLSNLLLSLQGEELYIHQLELSLCIHSIDERGDAILKFQESALEILKLFSLEIPHNIYNSIIKNDSCKYSDEIFSLNIEKETIGSVESVVLIIKSEM